jgi:hypothetical protein
MNLVITQHHLQIQDIDQRTQTPNSPISSKRNSVMNPMHLKRSRRMMELLDILVGRGTFIRLQEEFQGQFWGLLSLIFLVLSGVLLRGIVWVLFEIIKGRVCMKRFRSWILIRDGRFWQSWHRAFLLRRWDYNWISGIDWDKLFVLIGRIN